MLKKIDVPVETLGAPPGTLVYSGEPNLKKTHIKLLEYNEAGTTIKDVENFNEIIKNTDPKTKKWINIRGIHDIQLLKDISDQFNYSLLSLEDILNPSEYPKIEIFDNYILIIIKDIAFNKDNDNLNIHQVSIVLGDNIVFSFQDTEEDIFKSIEDRIINNDSFRKKEIDYLAYCLLDFVIDKLFDSFSVIGDRIEILENKLVINPNPKILPSVYKIKRELIFLRGIFRPMKDIALILERSDSPLINSYLKIYLRDLYDHILQLISNAEIYRETISHILDIYLSSVNNKMAEVMKTLAIIATVFIPLTFIAGVYGTNFKYIPEFEWKYSYFAYHLVNLFIVIIMFIYFRRKKWL